MFKLFPIIARAEPASNGNRPIRSVAGPNGEVGGARGPLPANMTTMSQYYRSGRGTKLGGNARTKGKVTTIKRVTK